MELKEIGEAIGIPNRTMRYIMEQGIVPGLSKINKGRGSRRNMSVAQARLVGLAALLHELGYRGPIMQSLLKKAKSKLQQEIPVIVIPMLMVGMQVDVHLSVFQLYEKIQ